MIRFVLTLSMVVLTSTLATTNSLGQTRPSTVDRPCVASRQLVLARGAVVLGTGGFTYDRFVRDRRFCEINEYLEPALVPSLDHPSCFVGYRCRSGPPEWWDD